MKEFIISEAKVETAVLVGLITQMQDERKTNEYLDELAFLAETAGAEVVKRFTQKLPTANSVTYVGKGKLEEIRQYIQTEEEEELWKYVKAADKMSAYIKCLEEKKSGNMDFADAEKTIYQAIVDMNIPEADYFIKEYIPAYMGTLDASGE